MTNRQKEATPGPADSGPNLSSSVELEPTAVVAGFRRSRRVSFEAPVDVHLCRANEAPASEAAKTLTVSAHGALLALTTPVAFGEILRLVNPRTRKEIQCRVCRFAMQYPNGTNQVGVEFVAVSPAFWDVPSPPADWDPSWVPPAERMPPPFVPPAESFSPSDEERFQKDKFGFNAREDPQESLKASPDATKPKRWLVLKWPLLALAASALLFTLWMVGHRSSAGPAVTENSASSGVAPQDASMIPELDRFHLATAEDFDPAAVSWLGGSGQQASGKIPGLYNGSSQSTAYILVGKENDRRVIILAEGQVRSDARYPVIAVAARLPKELIQKINWADPSPPEADGDGLLIVRAANTPSSGVVLFLRGTQVVSGSPSDYRQIPLSQLP